MFLIIGRALKESFINFWRNGWLSVAAVSVLVLSLFVVGAVFMLGMVADNVLKNVENKVNISVYFKSDVAEEKIQASKKDLEGFKEISSVEYISKDKALEIFKRDNADEQVIMESLEEIGENPLLASLVIKANNPSQYQVIVDYVNNASFKDDVSRVNYGKNKDLINRLNSIILQIKKIGLVLAGIFGAVSILIIFNTIRITIYTHKQEIEVMRLVGSSNMFIRLPFIFEGIIYGVVASLVASIILMIAIKFINVYASSVVSSGNLFAFYLDNALYILGLQIAIGAFLGIASSWIAMRKYLKI
ncbi:MAG TPA: permease-like cell division protein FtsX [Candidatus Moranbacteria bacterium]|nr:permease-like cell division protein FtsX [Candidatus Moranbacteria bacterium]